MPPAIIVAADTQTVHVATNRKTCKNLMQRYRYVAGSRRAASGSLFFDGVLAQYHNFFSRRPSAQSQVAGLKLYGKSTCTLVQRELKHGKLSAQGSETKEIPLLTINPYDQIGPKMANWCSSNQNTLPFYFSSRATGFKPGHLKERRGCNSNSKLLYNQEKEVLSSLRNSLTKLLVQILDHCKQHKTFPLNREPLKDQPEPENEMDST